MDYDLKNIFIRTCLNHKYYINEKLGKIVLSTKELANKFIKPILNKKSILNKIITFDIETLNKNGKLIPFLYCMYDGKKSYSFFSSSPEQLFQELLKRKYRGYSVFAHNLSRFDIIFIFKYIASLHNNKGYKISCILKDGDIISINIKNSKKGVNITLRDSYLLLQASLLKLSKAFNCKELKGMEPVLLNNDSLSVSEKYYAQENILHYNKDVKVLENFQEWRKLIIKYCNLDCVILHEILSKFNELIFTNFEININDYPTFSSLSFAIFRKHFLLDFKIPVTTGKVFEFIKESYTGGSTDMYIPKGENILCFDVNSLYPSVMRDNLFPVGNINEFEGDITILKDKYWIADVDVKTKRDLQHPYLQIHHKTKGGLRTISPNGAFSMKIHSCEYFNALKDYNFTIKNGYFFDQANIFSKFVDELYKLRISYPKDNPMNFVCKLILNSLYGRFGMHQIIEKSEFMNKNEFLELTKNYEVTDFLDLEESGLFVSYEDSELLKNDHNISISIASAVTAYARVLMSRFKNRKDFKLYYTDTDSIFIDKELPTNIINNELGNFKLEYILKEAIFLGPKVYGGVTNKGEYICKIKGYKNPKLVSLKDLER